MYFRTVLALLAAPLVALAQNPNPFIIPEAGIAAKGGKPLTLQWKPTTQGTVTLVLRSGSSNNLNSGTVIASSISNSGSYTWTPSNQLTRGSDYTVEIVSDSDPSATNYLPYFVLDTDNTVATATPMVTLGAETTSIASQTNVQTSTSTGSSSSATATDTTVVTSTRTTGTTGGMMTTGSSSASSQTDASFRNTAGSSSSVTPASGNSAPRATAMAGMLGMVALGALAL
ncbi:hypothetical protein LTR09_000699 [Extremus antarcticus]|uniref:Yeast cell wall synthesis Kre9/Knh1-like N-terminal domain-containing protein n=1 Tax=Extremus antarcticus TaxID=702011 RepID=A0AAJ0GK90_9PEZI|nr:hypothetical protein LTR09_000699 [Extremus antarcticus]